MSSHVKIQSTKNYSLFNQSGENRAIDVKKHKRLRLSMEKYGFLKSFPVVCVRGKNGKLYVKDGQHRLALAELLGLSVWYVEEDTDFDVATVNSTAKVWTLADFAEKYAARGNQAYAQGMAFAKEHGVPLGTAFAMLAGTTSFGNVEPQFVDGTFEIKDRAWAEAVVSVYGPLVKLNGAIRNAAFLAACMATCRVAGFDTKRLIAGARQKPEALKSYSTREGYLEMLEDLYNHRRSRLVALKNEAIMAMRARNVVGVEKKTAAPPPDAA